MADNVLGQGVTERMRLLMERARANGGLTERAPASLPEETPIESQDPMASEAMSLLDSVRPEAGSFQEILQNKLREMAARRIAGKN